MALQLNTELTELDFSTFYWMSQAFRKGEVRVESCTSITDPLGLLKGDAQPSSPIEFRQVTGKHLFDVLPTTYAAISLVSRKFVEALEASNFNGWSTWPVVVYGQTGSEITGYTGLSVLGRCGPVDVSRCKRVWRQITPSGKPYLAWYGLYFDPSTWDGSDLFCPDDTGHVIVAERVKMALERARVTNVDFTALPEVEQQILTDD